MVSLEKIVAKMRADEPGSARDEDIQDLSYPAARGRSPSQSGGKDFHRRCDIGSNEICEHEARFASPIPKRHPTRADLGVGEGFETKRKLPSGTESNFHLSPASPFLRG